MSAAGKVAYYTYDAEGHRIGKHYEDILYFIPEGGISYTTVRFPVDTKYFYSGDTLTYVQIIDDSARDIENLKSLYFTYDAVGPLSVNYNGTEYFYLKNAQGDVTGIVDDAGTQVVAYTYDAWGKLLSTTGSMAGTLGEYNPLRYRGYVYDTETGLYYLNSRYYNPETGRFINADGYVSTGQGFSGHNMFVYCGNNPVMRQDDSGRLFFSAVVSGVLGAVFGGISAAQNGENIVVGALVGGLAGAFMGIVGGFAGIAVKAGANALKAALIVGTIGAATGASADAFTQYTNYELAKAQSAKESQTSATGKSSNAGQGTQTKTVSTGQSQELITRVQTSSSFSEYVDSKRIVKAAIIGGVFAAADLWGGCRVEKISFSANNFQKKVQEAMLSFESSFLQFALDARLSG